MGILGSYLSGVHGEDFLAGVSDVARFLATDERATRCVSQRLLSYAVGRDYLPSDRTTVDEPVDAAVMRTV